jgi:hypothetical protein
MTGAPNWSDEKTEALGIRIDHGLSAGQAARELRVSRGAVSGRAFRLGWVFGSPRTDEQRLRPATLRALRAPRKPRTRRDPADSPVQLTVAFDRETYDEIISLARSDGCSRVQKIRDLVEWGLEAGVQP